MQVILLLEFFILLSLLLWGIVLLISAWSGAPFIPTGRGEISRIFDAAPLKSGAVFYDLGSGDGRVTIEAARRGARAVGYEQSRTLVLWSRTAALISGRSARPAAKFIRGNFLKADLSKADAVFCYLMPAVMVNLRTKFEKELKPGTVVISRAFSIPGWTPQKTVRFYPHAPRVFMYKIPALRPVP